MSYNFALINAFTKAAIGFRGNPCAVILLKEALTDDKMQKIAADLHQPATAFLLHKQNLNFEIRWFAPDAEILLCGHGSLAATQFVSTNFGTPNEITFDTKTGQKIKGFIRGNNPGIELQAIRNKQDAPPSLLEEALGKKITAYYSTDNKDIVVLENEKAVQSMQPNFQLLKKIDVFGYAVTAKSSQNNIDFVSRTLVPHVQQLEDHATGSSHAALIPYWHKMLKKSHLKALQLSPRGGYFEAEVNNNQIILAGETQAVIEGNYHF